MSITPVCRVDVGLTLADSRSPRENDRSERPERGGDRDRGRDRDRGNSGDLENLREKVVDLGQRLDRTAQLGLLTARDAGEARSALQVVFFLTGLARDRVKEVVTGYQADRDAVMAGTRDLPLKLRIYESILKNMVDVASRKGAEAAGVARELEQLGFQSGIAAVANAQKAPTDDRPWILVVTFSHGELGQKLRNLWCSSALKPVFAKQGGNWPELGLREGTWKPGKLYSAVAEDVGFTLKGKSKGKGNGGVASGIKRQSESPPGRGKHARR